MARLGDLVDFYAGVGFPNQYQGSKVGEFPFAKVSDISKSLEHGGSTISEAANYVTGEIARKLRAKPFPTGTIVFAKIGEAIRKNRRALTSREMVFDNNVMGIHARNDDTDIDYLMRYLDTVDFYKLANTTAVPSLRKSVLGELEIPLPPLDEQKRIAAILDKADQLRQKRRQAIALLDSLTQSIFLEMFGDPASNPKGWPIMRVGDLATKYSDGPFGSNLKSDHYVDQGIRVIRLQNIGVGEFIDNDRAYITEEHFKSLVKHECLPGDVLIGTLGDPNLRACIQPDWLPQALNKADCVQLRPNCKIALSEYCASLINQESTMSLAQGLVLGQTRGRISMGRLRELELPIAPLKLQMEFASMIRAYERRKQSLHKSLQHLDTLFASLQHRAFSGQL